MDTYIEQTSARKPRKFSVKIDAQLNKKRLFLLSHTKWYPYKAILSVENLRDMRGYAKKWMGEIYDETIDYNDLPWETDALKMEPLLYESWIDYKKEVKYGKGTFGRDVA